MQISFLNPGFFVLLALIPALWFLPRWADDKLHAVLRSLLLALVITALAQPVLLAPGAEQHQVVIVDRSASLSDEQRAEAEAVLVDVTGTAGDRDQLTVVELGVPSPGDTAGAAERRLAVDGLDSDSSLSNALALAAQQLPVGVSGRVILISDGLSTDRDWGGALTQLTDRGIPVDVHDLGRRSDDVYPAALEAIGDWRVGDTVEVSVTAVGTGPMTVALSDEEGEELARTSVRVDGRGEVLLAFEPERAGFTTLTAEITTESGNNNDSNPSNNRLSAGFAVQPPIRVLYVADRERGSADELQQLLGTGFVVEAPDMLLSADLPLDGYELAMVDDVPAESLPDAFQQQIMAAVRDDGLGLLFSGGRRAFGEGGYYETPVADVLPVEFQQRTEKKEPTIALAIIIDTSGSMWGRPIELGKQMARLSLNKLRRTDTVGVVEFYGNKSWAAPLQTLRNRSSIERAISRLHADGGTTLMPAIEEAYYGLKNVRATYKHILAITDAQVEDADYDAIVRQMAEEGVTVSTVLPGLGEDDPILSRMARIGGGRFYAVPGPYNLSEINFRKPDETRLPLYKTGPYPVAARTGSGWWGEVDMQGLPAVSAYVEVQNREGADVLLETEDSAHPVLSSWRVGLGRVTALMTEPVGPGTDGWQNWADYGRLLSRVMRRTAADGRAFDYQLLREGERLYVDALRNGPGDARPVLSLVNDDIELSFDEMAPGWFRSNSTVPASEDVRLLNPVTNRHLIANAAVFAETQVDPWRGLDLERLAAVTGGAVLSRGDAGTGIAASAGALSIHKLWPWLVLLSLLVYLGELLYRRWPTGSRAA